MFCLRYLRNLITVNIPSKKPIVAIAILRAVYEVVNILEQIVKGKVEPVVISTLQDSKNFKKIETNHRNHQKKLLKVKT